MSAIPITVSQSVSKKTKATPLHLWCHSIVSLFFYDTFNHDKAARLTYEIYNPTLNEDQFDTYLTNIVEVHQRKGYLPQLCLCTKGSNMSNMSFVKDGKRPLFDVVKIHSIIIEQRKNARPLVEIDFTYTQYQFSEGIVKPSLEPQYWNLIKQSEDSNDTSDRLEESPVSQG